MNRKEEPKEVSHGKPICSAQQGIKMRYFTK